jgi:hypothetical protein
MTERDDEGSESPLEPGASVYTIPLLAEPREGEWDRSMPEALSASWPAACTAVDAGSRRLSAELPLAISLAGQSTVERPRGCDAGICLAIVTIIVGFMGAAFTLCALASRSVWRPWFGG